MYVCCSFHVGTGSSNRPLSLGRPKGGRRNSQPAVLARLNQRRMAFLPRRLATCPQASPVCSRVQGVVVLRLAQIWREIVPMTHVPKQIENDGGRGVCSRKVSRVCPPSLRATATLFAGKVLLCLCSALSKARTHVAGWCAKRSMSSWRKSAVVRTARCIGPNTTAARFTRSRWFSCLIFLICAA